MTYFLDLNSLQQIKSQKVSFEMAPPFGNMTIYTMNGEVHREDGPAIITDISQEWYHHGKCHREDGPARLYKEHPHTTDKLIAEWHFHGDYKEKALLSEEVFQKHWHKG